MFNVTRRGNDEGIKESLYEAMEQSDNSMKQLMWVNNHEKLSYKQKVMNMVDLVQREFHNPKDNEIKLTNNHIDFLMRGFKDALEHMQADLPEGVYKYIYTRIDKTLISIMKQQ